MSKLSLGVQKVAATMDALVPLDDATRMLAAIATPADAKHLESLAAAAKRYASSLDARNYAAEIQLRAGRRGGQMLIEMAETGQRKLSGKSNAPLVLADLGIEPMRSSRWQALARKPEPAFEAYIAKVKADAEPLGAHIAQNSGENEWFTPAPYIEAAVRVMGGIDLDPASNPIANEVVGAETFYTVEDSGLDHGWHGRVWMNPPYAQPLIWRFSEKLSEEVAQGNVTEAIALVNNATDTAWFQRMAEVAKALCFPARRVKFWHPERESAPLQGQAVIYFGENVKSFCTEFGTFGFTAAIVG